MPRKKKQTEIVNINEDLNAVSELMYSVIEDTGVPRNIRTAVQEAREKSISGKNSVEISSAIYILDDISNDINMPSHTRTEIWNIISSLELIKEKLK